VEKQNRAFAMGMGWAKMQSVKHRTVYRQGGFFVRQPESGVTGFREAKRLAARFKRNAAR